MKRFVALALCMAASFAWSQQRYTVSDEDAAGPGTPRVVVLRDAAGGVEAAIAPSEGGELSSFRILFLGNNPRLSDMVTRRLLAISSEIYYLDLIEDFCSGGCCTSKIVLIGRRDRLILGAKRIFEAELSRNFFKF